MLTWASIALKALSLVNMILAWMNAEANKEMGRKEAISKALDAAIEGVKLANEARESVLDDLKRNPDGLRDNDGFRRTN